MGGGGEGGWTVDSSLKQLTTDGRPKVERYASSQQAAERVADFVTERLERAVKTKGHAVIALAGGSTPAAVYDLLAQAPRRGRIPWEKVWVLFGDERIVPADSPLSNLRMAREHLLSRVPVPGAQVVPMDTGTGREAPADLADRMANKLQDVARQLGEAGDVPAMDVCLLGMGPEGHTASLFPGSAALAEAGERTSVLAVSVPATPPLRLTLTPSALRLADQVVFLVCGEGKAQAVRDALTGDVDVTARPTQAVRPSQPPIWVLDEKAASLLPNGL